MSGEKSETASPDGGAISKPIPEASSPPGGSDNHQNPENISPAILTAREGVRPVLSTTATTTATAEKRHVVPSHPYDLGLRGWDAKCPTNNTMTFFKARRARIRSSLVSSGEQAFHSQVRVRTPNPDKDIGEHKRCSLQSSPPRVTHLPPPSTKRGRVSKRERSRRSTLLETVKNGSSDQYCTMV